MKQGILIIVFALLIIGGFYIDDLVKWGFGDGTNAAKNDKIENIRTGGGLSSTSIEREPGFYLLFSLERVNGKLKSIPALTYIQRNGLLASIVSSFNKQYKLPFPVFILFQKINAINAYYDPSEKRILFGLEMVEIIYNSLSTIYRGQELIDATTDAVVYMLFHEIGHAMIDIYHIPITGKEEAAADNFATYLFSTGNDRVERIALNGAQIFFNLSVNKDYISKMEMAGEHLLDAQRAYTIMSLLYGKDQVQYQYLVTSGILPKDFRGQEMCIYEYRQLVNSWSRILSPWVK